MEVKMEALRWLLEDCTGCSLPPGVGVRALTPDLAEAIRGNCRRYCLRSARCYKAGLLRVKAGGTKRKVKRGGGNEENNGLSGY